MSALKLQPNNPELIALEYSEGLPVESKFGGDQVMFSLVDGRKLYASPALAAKIDALGLAPGEEFEIVKSERAVGQRRIVDFQVSRAGSASEASPARIPPTTQPSTNQIGERRTAAPTSYGAALRLVSSPAPGAVASPVEAAPAVDYDAYYRAAVDVAANACTYAKSKGLLLTPSFEDVRCMAATFIIRKGGR